VLPSLKLPKQNRLVLSIALVLSTAVTVDRTKAENFDMNQRSFGDERTVLGTNWAQPPLGCPEEIIPELPSVPCLDLTQVVDPLKDWPASITPVDLTYWKSRKRPIQYCRASELLRREKLNPGSISAGKIEDSWMRVVATEHQAEKLKAVYYASRKNGVPVQVLTGALFQESLFAELGIALDGNNYSCGVGQINIIEWCHWANRQPEAKKTQLGWPTSSVQCSDLQTTWLKPFYDIALTRLAVLPEYRLVKKHFQNIALKDVAGGFPKADKATQKSRYQMATSFINNCSDPTNGILAKASELKLIYDSFIPNGLKNRERYATGNRFQRTCAERGSDANYPLHQGWLLAVGIYNAGPRAVDALAHYHDWSQSDLDDASTFQGFQPTDMIEAFYWSGKYHANDDKIHLISIAGHDTSWNWFKPCILQRHIANVIRHVTLPGQPDLATSLEGTFGCAKSTFDPVTGDLVHSAVPPFRQLSSGVK
jgi:hypothetical protein